MRASEPEELGTILSIWAHPDDETYLAGALMAAAADNGQRVVCVSATAGERGTDDPAAWPPARLGAIRRAESAAAMAVLGVHEHIWLDYPDGALAELDQRVGTDRLATLIDDVRPDTILTFGPDGVTFHPDHITVGRWTTQAWEQTGRSAALLHAAAEADHHTTMAGLFEELGIFMTDERPLALTADELEVHLVLDGPALDRKLQALAAMPSQTAPIIGALGQEGYRAMVGTEAFVAAGPDASR